MIEGLKRLVRYRLFIPLRRSRHPPEYTARGIAVGLFWAMTPTVGIQMALVFAHWLIARRVFQRDFSVILAMAWTWVTNFATVVPVYYVFYVTGQVLLGRWDDISGWHGFVVLWQRTFGDAEPALIEITEEGVGVYETFFSVVVRGWGLAMVVGSVPWAIAAGWLGYVWSLRVVRRLRAAQENRRRKLALPPRAKDPAAP